MGRAPRPTEAEARAVRAETPELAVTFRVGGQTYALPLDAVTEIQQIVEFTPIPAADPAVLGLLDVRGTVMVAYDLGQLLGLAAVTPALKTPMLICRLRDVVACLVIEDVCEVVEVGSRFVASGESVRAPVDCVLGACHVGDELVIVLDYERLIPEELSHTCAREQVVERSATTPGGGPS